MYVNRRWNDLTDDDYEAPCPCLENQGNNFNKCTCGYNQSYQFPETPVLGQSYTPIQQFGRTFKPCIGLKMGTIFPDLVSPYMPGESSADINYLATTNEMKEECNRC